MRRQSIVITAGTCLVAATAVLNVRCSRATSDATSVATAKVLGTPPVASTAPPVVKPEPPAPGRFAEALDVTTFQKGNIHTHTSWSDGDSPPDTVYRWYRDHGYAFVAVTDHNSFTDPAQFRPLERKGKFVLVSGEEITMTGAGKQVHVNALCTQRAVGGGRFDTAGAALAWAVGQVKAQDGVALVNHPNFDWALTAADVPSARGAALLEIASGHPYVHTEGDETHASHEAIWDAMLSAGETFAGVAVDDSHYFRPHAKGTLAKPGRAWVQVFADQPTRDAICAALGQGRLYSSTGVELSRITVKDATMSITVPVAERDVEVVFVGKGGVVLQRARPGDDGAAAYTLRGGEGYVRVRVDGLEGKHAWTQPARVVHE